jgi:hypothetical protein
MMAIVALLLLAGGCGHEAPPSLDHLAAEPVEPQAFYATHSAMTDPGRFAGLLADTPADLPGIMETAHGILLHLQQIERRGLPFAQSRIDHGLGCETVEALLAEVVRLDPQPLTVARPIEHRAVGICTHFAMLTCAMLREHGIPARIRHGFETYVSPRVHHDHTIGEYWNEGEARWVRFDPEIPDAAAAWPIVDFDRYDLPPRVFVDGCEAWRQCREGEAAPRTFGIRGDEWLGGWDFVINGLLHDIAALCKIELLPWKDNSVSRTGYERAGQRVLALFDEAARAAAAGDSTHYELRLLVHRERALQPGR